MQVLVKALSGVSPQQDVVRTAEAAERQDRDYNAEEDGHGGGGSGRGGVSSAIDKQRS